jgi:ubiquinone/menaquinone biosynthesis C-methylase UbiE
MDKKAHSLFNAIAPIYGLFYFRQKKRFIEVIDRVSSELDLSICKTILDVGCGTGALCSVFHEIGFKVTGIDPAKNMLNIAKTRTDNKDIQFILADVLRQLPFVDKSFDISIASYVAHGLQKNERIQLYSEMSRVTKQAVIIYDYNQNRSFLTSLIEWLERGDYFRFIRSAEEEMTNCISEMKRCFSKVTVIDVDKRASWYICTPF